MGCGQIAGASHWLFSHYLTREQTVQNGAKIVTAKETVVTHAFLKRRCLATSVIAKCPFFLSYSIVVTQWPCLSIDYILRKLFMFHWEPYGQTVKFQQ